MPSPWRSHRGLGDTTGGAGASPDTFISPPGSWRCLYLSVCQATSACRPALNLPALGGFHPLPPPHLIPLPPIPAPLLSPAPPALLLEADPNSPHSTAWTRRHPFTPLHAEGHVHALGCLFHITSPFSILPPFPQVTQMYLLPPRHRPDIIKDGQGLQAARRAQGGLCPQQVTGSITQGSIFHSSGRRGSGTKGRREGLVRSHQH